MARIFAWCDHPHAPTGFGRSAKHVLYAYRHAGHEIVQLAVNADANLEQPPWRVEIPSNRNGDPYGLSDLKRIIDEGRFDAVWSTFDPEVPWRYAVPGTEPQVDAIGLLLEKRRAQGGMALLGWFPTDGGPFSEFEMGILANPNGFDVAASMSPHIHELVEWTIKLRGQNPDPDAIRDRLPIIPHGVELDKYVIPTAAQRAEAKREMGIDPDTFVILQLERNQQRKQNYLALEVMEILLSRKRLAGKVLLYQHMLENEETQASTLGFNLPELAWRYGLQPGRDIRWPGGFVAEETLHDIVYRAADCFLSVSTGEGFQYPAWEALACGVPLVVPNTDARRAWFAQTPNVYLYGADERRLVMRGGYNRRMNIPRPAEAAQKILKLIDRGPKEQQRVGGRAFVEKTANVEEVQARWVDLLEDQLELTRMRRMENGVVDRYVLGPRILDVLVDCSPAFGLGDTILAAPALEALRKREPRVGWRLPPANHWLARLLDVADIAVETVPASRPLALHHLYHPKPAGRWIDGHTNRTEQIAELLADGEPLELERYEVLLPEDQKRAFAAQFRERFGADPAACIGICTESPSPHRALPKGVALDLANMVRARGATPVLIGRAQLPFEQVGIINLTGRTGPEELRFLCGSLGAVISVDTATLYLAAAHGTPVVGVFTCIAPDARLRWIGRGPKATVTPPPDVEIAGETFPAGAFPKAQPGEWAARISQTDIGKALDALLGLDEPTLTVED